MVGLVVMDTLSDLHAAHFWTEHTQPRFAIHLYTPLPFYAQDKEGNPIGATPHFALIAAGGRAHAERHPEGVPRCSSFYASAATWRFS